MSSNRLYHILIKYRLYMSHNSTFLRGGINNTVTLLVRQYSVASDIGILPTVGDNGEKGDSRTDANVSWHNQERYIGSRIKNMRQKMKEKYNLHDQSESTNFIPSKRSNVEVEPLPGTIRPGTGSFPGPPIHTTANHTHDTVITNSLGIPEHSQHVPEVGEQNDASNFFGIEDKCSNATHRFRNDKQPSVSSDSKSCQNENSESNMTEKIIVMPYGYVRLDSHHTIPRHGKHKPDSSVIQHEVVGVDSVQNKTTDSDIHTVQYPTQIQCTQQIGYADIEASSGTKLPIAEEYNKIKHASYKHEEQFMAAKNSTSFIEEQYFPKDQVGQSATNSQLDTGTTDQEHMNYIDQQYFGQHGQGATEHDNTAEVGTIINQYMSDHSTSKQDNVDHITRKSSNRIHSPSTPLSSTQLSSTELHPAYGNISDKEHNEKRDADMFSSNMLDLHEENAHEDHSMEGKYVYIDQETKQQKRMRERLKPNIENPETAYDMAMKIRQQHKVKPSDADNMITMPQKVKWKGKVDSRGFRILKEQVLDLENMPQDVVVKILKDSIIFENDQLIAIDKPYGMPSHGGPGIHHSIGQLLNQLLLCMPPAHRTDSLHLVHRLDKETTGVMLIAKNPQMAYMVREKFKRREVRKKYLVITKGIPNPKEGIIDIPLGEGTVGKLRRMALRPKYDPEMKLLFKTKEGGGQEAVTNYQVLDTNNSTALVECQPVSGLKHQIRCHLAFGLNTPILGDHKYSHYSKLAPQKLHPETLQHLGIRQAKVRHLPMHLHASELMLPELLEGRNLFLRARLPSHFLQNMHWLKLKLPS